MKARQILYIALTITCLLILLFAFGLAVSAQTPAPTGTDNVEVEPTATGLLDEVVSERTPVPTATPSIIEQKVDQIALSTGFYWTMFLGLSGPDWLNLGISLLIVAGGYLLGTLLIRRILPQAVQRTPSTFDDELLKVIGSDLRWLVVIFVLDFSTRRLTFLSADVKIMLADTYFVLLIFFSSRVVWKLLDLGDEWYRLRLTAQKRLEQLDPLLTLLVRLGRVIVAVAALTITLSHFGVNVTAFAAALGLGGLAISLAAKDTIADAIAGFIILVDQPFRIGDRIEIQGVNTWGDVVDIGLRTTRIRTRDNRLVIVPNSIIGSNQVVNYTYPDPRYRIQTHVGVAYGTDIEMARRTIIDTVRQIEGVLLDKPVDALYNEMGDSAMIFHVRWWIESYVDTRRMFDRVHTALQHALDEAGIESPFPTQTLNLQVDEERVGQATQELKET